MVKFDTKGNVIRQHDYLTLEELFAIILHIEERTKNSIPDIVVYLEYQYSYDEEPTSSVEILQHSYTLQHHYPDFFEAKGFMWWSDWYHCVIPESVKVWDWEDLQCVFNR